MEEVFIFNYVDLIDVIMNKIFRLKDKIDMGIWLEYDRIIESKLYL